MILRDYYEMLKSAETTTSAACMRVAATHRERLERAMRFVFRPGAAVACEQIAERPDGLDAARTQLFAPWPTTWIEWEGSPHAILWMADDEAGRTGGCIAVTRTHGVMPFNLIPFRVDLDVPEYIRIPQRALSMFADARSLGLPAHDPALLRECNVPVAVGRTMLAAWALLATNGMTASNPADLGRLNRGRARRGLYPLLGYREIRLNLDAERAVRTRERGHGTGQMPLHPVRAHLRLLPTGRVVIVTAHMRGNPERGIRSHHYTVGRDEDMRT